MVPIAGACSKETVRRVWAAEQDQVAACGPRSSVHTCEKHAGCAGVRPPQMACFSNDDESWRAQQPHYMC